MYAIIEDGSRQYRAEAPVGTAIELTKVLLVEKDGTTRIGQPMLAEVKVVGEVVGLPTVKTVAQSFRRRKASKRLRGHTQFHLRVMVKSIVG